MDDSQERILLKNNLNYKELKPGTLGFENCELELPECWDKLIHCNVREEYNKLPNNQMFEKLIIEYLPVWKKLLSDLPNKKKQILRVLENLSAHLEIVHKTINNIMKGYV